MVSQSWIQAFVLLLVHSLWQGMLLGIVAAVVLVVTKNRRPSALRYHLISWLLPCFLLGCVITFTTELRLLQHPGTPGGPGIFSGFISETTLHLQLQKLMDWLTSHSGFIAGVWLLCFLCESIKTGFGIYYIARLKPSEIPVPSTYWQQVIDGFCIQLNIPRKVQLVETALAKIPMAAGHFKPLLYIPVGMLNHLPPAQIEAILLHELAHIKRNDYLAGLLQQFLLMLFFFNPGLRWIIKVLKEQREHCCDDIAQAHLQDKTALVEALLCFARQTVHTPVYAAAFPGTGKQLLYRVRRIALQSNPALNKLERAFFIISIAAGIGLCYLFAASGIKPATAVLNTSPLAAVKTQPVDAPVNAEEQTLQTISVPENREIVQVVDKLDADPAPETEETSLNPGEESVEPSSVETGLTPEELLRRQAEADRAQAAADLKQAEFDRKQADLDRAQAERDRMQADRDREQADRDRKQADIDRLAAEQNRLNATQHP